jgi:hypothetical protein
MLPFTDEIEIHVQRLVFETWSVAIPLHFAEEFVEEGSYWHAWDECRSVSLTSMVLTEADRPVRAGDIARQLTPDAGLPLAGMPVEELPEGLVGWGVVGAAIQPARASRTLSGILVTDGHVLITTITSDDLDWARAVWLSVRSHESWYGLPTRTADAGARDRPN